jgi:hypothetical protein
LFVNFHVRKRRDLLSRGFVVLRKVMRDVANLVVFNELPHRRKIPMIRAIGEYRSFGNHDLCFAADRPIDTENPIHCAIGWHPRISLPLGVCYPKSDFSLHQNPSGTSMAIQHFLWSGNNKKLVRARQLINLNDVRPAYRSQAISEAARNFGGGSLGSLGQPQ